MDGQFQYEQAGELTSRATPELEARTASRIERIRQELASLGPERSRSDLERLLFIARDLDLRDTDIQEAVEEVRAELEGIDTAEHIVRHGLPVVEPVELLPAGERCHFVTPVRFGRRRTDQCGHLELTSERIRFRGALDLGVVWSEVSAVDREGHNLIVALLDSRRVLRFCCHSTGESARGAVISRLLVDAAVAQAV